MKRIIKGREPLALTNYRNVVPGSSWEQMKVDPFHGGQQAYHDCRRDSIQDQKGLCAFCEISIRDNEPLKCRVEHFHPKSDRNHAHNHAHNWALDWDNMLTVCNGGDNPHLVASGFHLHPTDKNLSCDAHKNRMIQGTKLDEQCEGWILNPLHLVAFPNLFRLDKGTGYLLPDPVACIAQNWPGNKHDSTEKLVQHTIDMLNLNCDRLAQARLRIIRDIEHNKKQQRQLNLTAQQGLANLAQRYFQTQWIEFFTTIRLCLGQAADLHLQSIQFQG